jgi:hypothetical protein
MFDRLQKPFLTVETGEAYQPIRLTYDLYQKDALVKLLDSLGCMQKNAAAANSWTWYWKAECDAIHFESLDSFQKNAEHPVRLGTLVIRDGHLHINAPSFKRACLGIPFFHKIIDPTIARVHTADFINKVFAIDERLPHGFSELFKEEDLERVLHQRADDYQAVRAQCESAGSASEAFTILSEYTKTEAAKRLPYAERYSFEFQKDQDTDIIFLGFYIFLRGRELVAIKRWFGETGYTLADAADETIEQVFGGMDIDIID